MNASSVCCLSPPCLLVYQHELPNVRCKSIEGVFVEYGPGQLLRYANSVTSYQFPF
jgi:hypothetical protein